MISILALRRLRSTTAKRSEPEGSAKARRGGKTWARAHRRRAVVASVRGGKNCTSCVRINMRAHNNIVKVRSAACSFLRTSSGLLTLFQVLISCKIAVATLKSSEPDAGPRAGLHEIYMPQFWQRPSSARRVLPAPETLNRWLENRINSIHIYVTPRTLYHRKTIY